MSEEKIIAEVFLSETRIENFIHQKTFEVNQRLEKRLSQLHEKLSDAVLHAQSIAFNIHRIQKKIK